MNGHRLPLAAWTLWFGLAGTALALPGEPSGTEPVAAQLVADTGAVWPGRPFTLGVRLRLADGWHVYWKHPGSSGLPLEIRLRLPDGFTAGPLQWPIPDRFMQPDGEECYGYEQEVLLAARIQAPPGLPERGTIEFGAECRWMACRELCRLGRADLRLALPVSPENARGDSGFDQWRDSLPAGPEEAGRWVDARLAGSMSDAEQGGNFRVSLDWIQAPRAVDWYPVTPDSLKVFNVRVEGEGARRVLRFAIRTLAGQHWAGEVLDSLLVFVDVSGRRRGVELPLRLRAASEGGRPPAGEGARND